MVNEMNFNTQRTILNLNPAGFIPGRKKAAGAGIGILSAEAGRLLLPVFYNIAGMNSRTKNRVIAPAASVDSYGVGLAYSF
jgi:hypothetical protein